LRDALSSLTAAHRPATPDDANVILPHPPSFGAWVSRGWGDPGPRRRLTTSDALASPQDGALDADEFAVAMYLCERAAEGEAPPDELSDDVMPPSKK
jgi:hypothetical protein